MYIIIKYQEIFQQKKRISIQTIIINIMKKIHTFENMQLQYENHIIKEQQIYRKILIAQKTKLSRLPDTKRTSLATVTNCP